MVSVKNLIVKDGNHFASRHGFLRLSRVLPTSQVFTSGYVNTETILHFFIMWRHEMNMSASFSAWIALKPAFSQLSSLIFKFISHVSENCFLKLKKKQAVKLTR